MSSIDERVVDMKFNNGAFEANAKKTLSTLENLKKGLNLDGAKKSLSGLAAEGKRFNLDGLASGIQGLASKFSVLSIAGITALASIANKAVETGAQMIKSLTLTPILDGFAEYELKMGSIQTILANTERFGTTLDDVAGSLDKLNEYADKTIYNFGDMTRNIGLFTNAGIDIEDATSMIQGFSNAAAASGTSAAGAAGAAYQLSQALSAGTIRLMDWRSLTNVGMGNKNMQTSLIEIAEAMGMFNASTTTAEAATNDFNGSLEAQWLSADVMSTYLKIMAGDMDAAAMAAIGLTDAQIEMLQQQQKTAEEAATKVRTWTQLIGTLQEGVGSSWAQTFDIVLGDFEEATELFTNISDTLGELISKAGDDRNGILQGWKDLGGRTVLIEGLGAAFHALMDVLTPIGEAFREIFPPMTAERLYEMTESFSAFLKGLKPGEQTIENIKRTFKGLFALLDIGWMVIKGIASVFGSLFGTMDGAGDSVLNFTGNIGDWIVSVRDALKEGESLQRFFSKLGEYLALPLQYLRQFAGWLGDIFSGDYASDGVSGLLDRLSERLASLSPLGEKISELWDSAKEKVSSFIEYIQPAVDAVKSFFDMLWGELGNAFQTMNFDSVLDMVNTGLLGGIVLLVKRFLDKGLDFGGLLSGGTGVLDSIKDAFNGITGTLTTMQNNLKADTLMKLAGAIALLTLSVVALSLIDSDKLTSSLTAMAVMFGQLLTSMAIFDKIIASGAVAKLPALGVALMLVSAALLILSVAVKRMAELEWDELGRGLLGIGVGLAFMIAATKLLQNSTGSMLKAAVGIGVLSLALIAMAKAVEAFSDIEWNEMAKGMAGISAVLLAAGLFGRLSAGGAKMIGSAAALLILGVALKAISAAVKDFGEMNWDNMLRGLAGMGMALAAIAVAMNLMPKTMLLSSVGLVAVAFAMSMLTKSLGEMGGMSWEEIGKSMTVLAGSLAILAGAMALMGIPLVLLGAVGLVAAAGALMMLAPAMIMLSGLEWSAIGTGLGALAAALGILAVGGILLIPAIPAFLALGVALLAIGAGVALAGAGVAALAVGLTALAAAGAVGAGAIILLGKAVISLIPSLMKAIGDGLIQMVGVIAESGTAFIAAGETLIGSLLTAIENKGPQIIDTLFTLIMALVDELEENVPKFVDSGLNMINGILEGIANNIPETAEQATLIVTNFLDAIGENVPKIVDAGMQMVVDLINGMANAIDQNSGEIDNAINNLIESMKNAFINSVSNFTGIGGDIIAGLASGIRNGVSSVISAATSVASSALNAAKEALGIHSPSRKFAELGKFVGQGFAQGLRGSRAQVKEAYWAMSDMLKDAMSDSKQQIAKAKDRLNELAEIRKKEGKLTAKQTKEVEKNTKALAQATKEYEAASKARKTLRVYLDDEYSKLSKLATQYESVNKKLQNARQALADAKQTRDDFRASTKDSYDDLASTTGPDVKLTDYLKDLRQQVEDTNKFGATLQRLRDLGLNDKAYEHLLSQGVDALPFVTELLDGGKGKIKELNSLGTALDKSATKIGKQATAELYQAGVDAAAGLVKGLKTQEQKLKKQMEKLAGFMVDSVKKKLKIKSPSREMMKIGNYSGQGIAKGLDQTAPLIAKSAEDAGQTAIDGIKESISNISDIIHKDIDANPTIRPVLDLSSVRKDATQLNGMLSNPSITADISNNKAASISAENHRIEQEMAQKEFETAETSSVTFNQYNNSPKALSEAEIYRQTKNTISKAKGELTR